MGHPIVCPDSIRLALHGQPFASGAEPIVWATAELMVKALFLSGHENVILDATNTSAGRRLRWHSTDWDIEYVILPTDHLTCLRRAQATNQNYLIPVINNMNATADHWDATPEKDYAG